MQTYSILFEENNFIYLETFDDSGSRQNLKIPVSQFSDWKKGKIEI